MKRRFLALSLLLLPFASCSNGSTEFWLPRNNLLPMVALDDHVAFVETNSQTAFVLDPADAAFTPRRVPVGKAPVAALKRNGYNKLLVLSLGDPGSADIPAVAADLRIIDANPAIDPVTYSLTGRFDGLAQSDDGRFLVLYHSPSGQSQSGGALFNPNEMTLVDFTPQATPLVPTLTGKSIRSLGGVPSDIVFSPAYTFNNGRQRSLAVVLSQNYVTILDLDNPNNNEISVPLCPTSTGCTLIPVQVLFDPAHLKMYVRANGSKDIFQITLTDIANAVPPPTPPSNDFVASLSMLSAGANPADMVLFGTGANTRIAVASADTKSLIIIDPTNSHSTTIATSIPANQIIPFTIPGLQPTDPPKQQALLVDRALGSTSVLFADLEQVETTGGLSIKDFPLGAAAGEVHALVDQHIVVLVAGRFSSSAALTVVDLDTRSFSAIGAGSVLSVPTFETNNPARQSRLWSVDQGTGLSYLDLVARPPNEPRLSTGETWLDQNIASIVPLAKPSIGGTRYLVVSHVDPTAIGNLTVLDADHPDRAKARTAHGFLLTNYLEREQP